MRRGGEDRRAGRVAGGKQRLAEALAQGGEQHRIAGTDAGAAMGEADAHVEEDGGAVGRAQGVVVGADFADGLGAADRRRGFRQAEAGALAPEAGGGGGFLPGDEAERGVVEADGDAAARGDAAEAAVAVLRFDGFIRVAAELAEGTKDAEAPAGLGVGQGGADSGCGGHAPSLR